jgi:signal transduction histidine kinase
MRATMGNDTIDINIQNIEQIGSKLRKNTVLVGMRVVDEGGEIIGQFGDLPNIPPIASYQNTRTQSTTSTDENSMDVVWPIKRTYTPYILIGRIDIQEIGPQVDAFIIRIISLVLLITTILTIVTMLALDRLVLSPVRKIHHAVATIARDPKGHTAPKLSAYGIDELHDVTKNFDLLNSRLKEAFDHIEKQNIELLKSELAEQSNHAKSEFMANMSHELRTPLNAILGFADMIHNQYLGPIEVKQYVQYAQDITQSGNHLLNLVDQILNVERIEAGDFDLHKEDVDITDLLEECQVVYTGQAADKNQSLSFEIIHDLKPLNADRKSLKLIFSNLISNAVQYTPDDGQIEVRAYASGDKFILRIKDTGVGIPQDRLTRIKEPFSRHETDPHRSQKGVGLGLAIASGLTELHEGNIRFVSNTEKGTTVTVELPY